MILKAVLVLSIFSNLLTEYFPFFTNFDELLAIIFFLFGVVQLIENEKKGIKVFTKLEIVIFALFFIFIFFGIFSSASYGNKNTINLEAFTLFADIKYMLIYFGTRVIYRKIDIENIGNFLIKLSNFFTFCCLILFLMNVFLNILPSFGVRFGINNIAYGFGHPAQFAASIIVLTTFNLYFNYVLYDKKVNKKYLIINLFLIFTAGRITSISFFIGIIFILAFLLYFKRISITSLILSLISIFVFAKDRISNQFFNPNEARGVLLRTSIEIAKDNFPFGAGLGMFGSHASRVNYSPLYYQYGISNLWGLSPIYSMFITDSYWAMIIGEYGFFGLVTNLIIFILLICNVFILSRKVLGFLSAVPVIYCLISSPIDTLIVSNSIVQLILATTLLVNIEQSNKSLIQSALIKK
ncbi:hypothetical protein [Peribacillus frigoritolerans]|uniref:hypothetical protein n=1 Tax=Peribacillus frigoritolerans TaxID=450367 RepID=UPI0025A10658|nr:hypothetical protein [Peribacillus frigoritolerans]MDM5307523.1 hypothetical protein [Peribacillus frigoritolerans]